LSNYYLNMNGLIKRRRQVQQVHISSSLASWLYCTVGADLEHILCYYWLVTDVKKLLGPKYCNQFALQGLWNREEKDNS
jgi:hypothetical protein